jgi:small subunit ribosomal protein S16
LLKIRLSRMGSKKKPSYRIVVIEKSRARDGRFIELLGHYNPKKKPSVAQLDKDRYAYWVAKGAQPSNTVRSVMKTVG